MMPKWSLLILLLVVADVSARRTFQRVKAPRNKHSSATSSAAEIDRNETSSGDNLREDAGPEDSSIPDKLKGFYGSVKGGLKKGFNKLKHFSSSSAEIDHDDSGDNLREDAGPEDSSIPDKLKGFYG